MIQINVITEQKETHRLRKWTYSCRGEGIVRDFGKVIYTLLYLKWMTNKDLLYSTWNSAQCYVQPGWEGFQGRMDTCICMAESFHCSPETTTTFVMGCEKAMAPHCSTPAWKIPWTEEPGGLQSMGSRRVGHDWLTSLSLFTFMHWRRKWQPTPVFLPGKSQAIPAWWAAVYGITQSRTRLKRLSSSRSSSRPI